MSAILALIVCVGSPNPAPVLVPAQSGRVVRYDPGIMEQVARNRTNPNHRGYVPGFRLRYDVDGYASRPSCKTLGQVWHASINGGPIRSYQQVDCAQTRDYKRQVRTGLLLEIDYRSAVATGIARSGRGRVVIWSWR